jgi:transposase
MTSISCTTPQTTWVGIDIAKKHNDVLVDRPGHRRRRFRVANQLEDYHRFANFLAGIPERPVIGFEATGNYHRTLAFFLAKKGFALRLVSSVAAARTREALYNSWDKNDPKDAQVIIHMLKTGVTQLYHDPLIHGINELQELSKTYFQISLHKVRTQHSILTHYLPLYFPEAEKYMTHSRAQWFTHLLERYPCQAAVAKFSREEFIEDAWGCVGRKVNKTAFLEDFYATATQTIGLPVSEHSEAIRMFRIVLGEHQRLCEVRTDIEKEAESFLGGNEDYVRLKTLPGIGPILSLTILAEAGDLRRFAHHRQFLKFCGFDLSSQQSGQFRGNKKLSKRGNRRLRYAFWMAATSAIRIRENSFRDKYTRYVESDPTNADLRRKAYTAVAAKMARVAYGMIKNGTDYRPFHERAVPGGIIPS